MGLEGAASPRTCVGADCRLLGYRGIELEEDELNGGEEVSMDEPECVFVGVSMCVLLLLVLLLVLSSSVPDLLRVGPPLLERVLPFSFSKALQDKNKHKIHARAHKHVANSR